MKKPPLKFADCKGCKFFNPRVRNPICGSCGAGEFYEEKIVIKRPSDNELMAEYGTYYDE